MASGPASHVKPVTKQTFGRASPEAAREAAGEALPNGANSPPQLDESTVEIVAVAVAVA